MATSNVTLLPGVVFFIGAGFTKAITETAPTGNDFLAKAFRESWSFSNDPRIQLELKDFLETAYHRLEQESQFPRVEDVLSLLDFCIANRSALNSKYDLERLVRLKGILVYLISSMIKESFYGRQRRHFARSFTEKLVGLTKNHAVAVISTNYDIVLDNSLLSKAESCNYGIKIRSSVDLPEMANNRAQLAYANTPDYWSYEDEFSGGEEARGQLNRGTIVHLKLHGSLNWVHCPKCDEIDVTIARKGAANLLEDEKRPLCVNPYCTCSYDAFLVGPTMLKTYTSRLLGGLWNLSEQAVAQTQKMVFVGYSMPEADYLIRALLIRALARNPNRESLKITVIDRKPDGASAKRYLQELTDRYTALLGDRVDVKGIGLDGLLTSFDMILESRKKRV